jgi:phosphosulfolactate synthase (CoM biosynthesis protein A)
VKARTTTRQLNGRARHRPVEPGRPGFERAFSFLEINQRQDKPRTLGLTEIRGPYYTPMGRRYLEDLFETMAPAIDSLKFAGGSFALFSRDALRDIIDTAHRFGVEVSTGGFIERVLSRGAKLVDRYIGECAEFGFDTIEISSGFISISTEDWIRLIKKVQRAGLKAKPEVGIQFGAGGASDPATLAKQGTLSPQWAIHRARQFRDAGAPLIMIESEGITECVKSWRTDVPAQFAEALGLEHIMFEAAEPAVFSWYVKNFGPEVSLFVDHSQIVQLEALRRGLWGTADLWDRVVTFKED